MKSWACDGLVFFRGAVDGLGCAKGPRRSRCHCSGSPTYRNRGFSPLRQPTTPDKFARLDSFTWNMPRQCGQSQKLNIDSCFDLKMPAW